MHAIQVMPVLLLTLLSALEPPAAPAGVQYSGHGDATIVDVCLLGGQSPMATSCDAEGCIHVWSTQTGSTAAHFAEHMHGPPLGRHHLGRDGALELTGLAPVLIKGAPALPFLSVKA